MKAIIGYLLIVLLLMAMAIIIFLMANGETLGEALASLWGTAKNVSLPGGG